MSVFFMFPSKVVEVLYHRINFALASKNVGLLSLNLLLFYSLGMLISRVLGMDNSVSMICAIFCAVNALWDLLS